MSPLTPFIGRLSELEDVQRLLNQPTCRLLTLMGSGGTGKTRLATQIAAQYGTQFKHGAVIVPLQPLQSAEFFIAAIAGTLNLPLSGQHAPLVQLGRFLADKAIFIVLDNFEHVLDAAAQLLLLLQQAPLAQFLITSREPLQLQEEWLYPLSGLAYPLQEEVGDGQQHDAVQLFNERAQRAYAQFSAEKEATAVVQICQLVDGMPLALELAAAWRRSLTCEEIAAEIQRDLAFLSTRLRNIPDRHRSIQAIFDQSWQQLSAQEKAVFKRLSVFQGGFERAAAEAVTGASLTILTQLVDRSMLRIGDAGGYQLHELLRQYAAEQLKQDSSEDDRLRAVHASYYIDFLHQREADITRQQQLTIIQAIRRELDNIRVAWRWSIDRLALDQLNRAMISLGYFYQYTGRYLEGHTLVSQAVELLDSMAPSEAVDLTLLKMLMCRAWYGMRFGQLSAVSADMHRSQQIYRKLDRPPLPTYLSDPASILSFVALIQGNFAQAVEQAQQVRQQAQSPQHEINKQFAYHLLAEANLGLGNYEAGRDLAQQAYVISQQMGDRWFLAYILNTLGQIAVKLGEVEHAKPHFQQSYDIRRAFNDPEGMALASNSLAQLALRIQDYDEAQAKFADSLRIYQKINDTGGLAVANKGLGVVAVAQKRYEVAQGFFLQAMQMALAIDFRPILLALLIDIAGLLWQQNQQTRAVSLLSFATKHDASDHDTKFLAQEQLNLYKLAMRKKPYEQATVALAATTLNDLCNALIYELSIPHSSKPAQDPTPPIQPLIDPLTPRELDVLHLLAKGLTNPEIAEKLVVSTGTVKFHTNKIFGKLGIRNRVEAVSRAQQLGIV